MLLGKNFKIALVSGKDWIWTQVCLTSQPELLYDLVQFVQAMANFKQYVSKGVRKSAIYIYR